MLRKSLLLIFVLALALSSCQNAGGQAPAEEAATAAPTRTLAAAAPTPAYATQEAAAPAGCTVTSAKTAPDPTMESLFPAVTDKDWTQGPKDAQVTVVEYGDFM